MRGVGCKMYWRGRNYSFIAFLITLQMIRRSSIFIQYVYIYYMYIFLHSMDILYIC